MPYVNDKDDDQLWPVLACSVNGTGFSTRPLSNWERQRRQYGWRDSRNGIPVDTVPPKGGSWGAANAFINAQAGMELAQTPSRTVRDPSLPVHDREYRESRTPFTSLSLDKKLSDGRGYTMDLGIGFGSSLTTRFPTDAELNAKVAQLDKKLRASRPTKPAFGLARALGELRDFHRLVEHANDIARLKASGFKPGRGWLSYQFGFAPTASDIAKCASVIIDRQRIIDQFLRDSGRLVRRSVSLESEITDVTADFAGGPGLYAPTAPYGATPTSTLVNISAFNTLDVRAFGMYEYFLGDPTGVLGRFTEYRAKAQKLLGTAVTPDVVWQLTPWSWLVDWYVDVSGLLGYASDTADYSLALRRGGYTINSTTSIAATVDVRVRNGSRRETYRLQAGADVFQSRRRQAASPYGLLQGWTELSPFQLSILTALGLSKRGY